MLFLIRFDYLSKTSLTHGKGKYVLDYPLIYNIFHKYKQCKYLIISFFIEYIYDVPN